MKRLIVGISGATGVQIGYRLLEVMSQRDDIEVHLVVSEGAKVIFERETDVTIEQVEALADVVWDNRNLAASISSGSFVTDGMVVAPCSMKSLSAIANPMLHGAQLSRADLWVSTVPGHKDADAAADCVERILAQGVSVLEKRYQGR